MVSICSVSLKLSRDRSEGSWERQLTMCSLLQQDFPLNISGDMNVNGDIPPGRLHKQKSREVVGKGCVLPFPAQRTLYSPSLPCTMQSFVMLIVYDMCSETDWKGYRKTNYLCI